MPTFRDWIGSRTAEGTPADADELYLRDDSGNISKRITYSGLKTALGSVFAPASNPVFTTNVEIDKSFPQLSLDMVAATNAIVSFEVDNTQIGYLIQRDTGAFQYIRTASHPLGAGSIEFVNSAGNTVFTSPVIVPDPSGATEALNRQTGDTRYLPRFNLATFFSEPTAATGGMDPGSIVQGGAYFFGGVRESGGSINEYIEYDVQCDGGTWTIDLFHRADINRGIYTVLIDGVSVGTIDGYAAAGATTKSQITGVAVAAGRRTVRFSMLTKNASSSGYRFSASAFSMTRTGS